MELPGLQQALMTTSLSQGQWLASLGLAAAVGLVIEADKWRRRRWLAVRCAGNHHDPEPPWTKLQISSGCRLRGLRKARFVECSLHKLQGTFPADPLGTHEAENCFREPPRGGRAAEFFEWDYQVQFDDVGLCGPTAADFRHRG
ncbi:MAG: hypothetical protein ACOYEV_09310 [Candidatus Nanopelagicales bacterium]